MSTKERIYGGGVSLPLSYAGPVSVDLLFENGAHARLSAAEIRIELIGEPTYVEDFPGTDG